MGTYGWQTVRNAGSWPPTGPGSPAWYTPMGVPKTLLSCPSVAGEGDVLVRTELQGYYGVWIADWTQAEFAPAGVYTTLMAEVGASGGTPPDPTLVGHHSLALTCDLETNWSLSLDSTVPSNGHIYIRSYTRGTVTSKARRGPNEYGALAPHLNLGIVTENDDTLNALLGSVGSWWSFTMRCLWFTP